MEIDPVRLADHLAKILFSDTVIREVVLYDRFACVAQSKDHSLLVAAPPLDGVEPLPEEIGLNLRVLVGTFRLPMFGEWRERTWIGLPTLLSVTLERLLVEREGARVGLLRLRPETVESRIDPATAEEMLRPVAEAPGFPLTVPSAQQWPVEDERQYFDEAPRVPISQSVAGVAGLMAATKVFLEVGPDGGRFVIPDKAQEGLTDIPHDFRAEQPYKLTFDSKPLIMVLRKLQCATRPLIHLAGPRTPVLFTTGDGFRYRLVPREALRTLVWA